VLHSQHVTLDTVLPALGARALVQMGMKGQSLGLCVKPVAERGSGWAHPSRAAGRASSQTPFP